MRYFLLYLSLLSLLYANKLSLQTLKEEPRVAYVISNGEYDDSPLSQSIENGHKIKTFLEDHDFEVTYKEDASKRDIIKGLRDFKSNLKPHGIALFYFSGHMIQVKEKNYLIPMEASIENDYHVLYEAIELDAILHKMYAAGNRLNIVIIDSSHKNPFGDRFRAKKKGISSFKSRKDTDIILSVKANKIVKDYPFTSKLISVLSHKGISNKEAFKTFKERNRQASIQFSNQDFYFNLPNKIASKEDKLWKKTLEMGSIAAYTAYISSYPSGKHTKKAQASLSSLNIKAKEKSEKKQASLEKTQKDKTRQKELETLQKENERIDLEKQTEAKVLLAAQEKARIEAEEKAKIEAEKAAALKEKKRLAIENTRFVEPVMVLIKPGSFIIGSEHESSDAMPAHEVKIAKEFYMGRYEVTNVEYNEFVRVTKRKRMIPPNWTTDMQPVVGVSWDDATAYAAWLSDLTDKTYRLPTEQEWEYVARAGITTRYYWGDRDTSHRKNAWRAEYPDNAHDYAWLKTNSQSVTHTVGEKKPNAWGLYDVTGNVWEWCSNPYTDDYNTPVEEQQLKVLRGGSWFSTPEEITLSHRGANVNDFVSYNIGFRLLREK